MGDVSRGACRVSGALAGRCALVLDAGTQVDGMCVLNKAMRRCVGEIGFSQNPKIHEVSLIAHRSTTRVGDVDSVLIVALQRWRNAHRACAMVIVQRAPADAC